MQNRGRNSKDIVGKSDNPKRKAIVAHVEGWMTSKAAVQARHPAELGKVLFANVLDSLNRLINAAGRGVNNRIRKEMKNVSFVTTCIT